MPIHYSREGHVDLVTVYSLSEARLIIHELNLKVNEYTGAIQQIDEELKVAHPRKNAVLARILRAFGRQPKRTPLNPKVRQLQNRRAELKHHIKTVENHITQIQAQIEGMIADQAKAA